MNNLSLVNIFGETGRFFYNINYMLNNEHLSLVNKIGDKTEFHEKTVQLIFLFFVIYEKRKWDETLIDVRSPCSVWISATFSRLFKPHLTGHHPLFQPQDSEQEASLWNTQNGINNGGNNPKSKQLQPSPLFSFKKVFTFLSQNWHFYVNQLFSADYYWVISSVRLERVCFVLAQASSATHA